MSLIDVIDDVIRSLDPEEVPVEFIVMAKIKSFSGEEKIVQGAELEAFMRAPQAPHIAESRVIYNVRKLRKAILEEVEGVFDEVGRMIQRHT